MNKIQGTTSALIQALTKSAHEAGLLLPFLYQNDAGSFQKPLRSAGAANLAQLRAVSDKYDAVQLFQRSQNGGFLVSQA